MASIEKIIKEKIAILENSPEAFISRVDKVQEELLKETLKLVGELDTENGIIKATEGNFAKIAQINEKLQGILNQGEYLEATKDIIADMDKTKLLNDTYFKKVVPEYKIETRLNEIYKANRTASINSFIGETALDNNLLQPVRQVLLQGISNEMSFTDMVSNISTTITGDAQRDGKLKKYAKQIASDTLSGSERNYTSMVADALDVQFVRYVGGTVEDTRCFCQQRNGKYFHIEEVRQWGDLNLSAGGLDESCKEDNGWQGMYIGTNSGNIEQWLGGYNCKHSLVYVSEINVPDEVIERATKAGYFKP